VNPVVAPGVAFASKACGWGAGDVATHVLPTGWGTVDSPWHNVLLKHPGAVPAGAGVAGWFGGLFGDSGKWHCAQTGAFESFVSTWVYVGPRHGCAGCGALTPWQEKHDTRAPLPVKSLPWQIWQAAKPELPGAFFAVTPWFWTAGGAGTQPAITGPWWQPAGLSKQETPEIPPERSDPWHCVQPLLPPAM
jgi:hypothetical protein